MDILELLETVNSLLNEGYSTAKIEQNLGYGKDTIRKKLNRAGYKYSKEDNKYIDKNEENRDVQTDKTHKNTLNNTKSYKKETFSVVCSNTTDYKEEDMEKIQLNYFKGLSDLEKIETINRLCDGKKTLKQIEEEYFAFSNISRYVPKNMATWDGGAKYYRINKSNIAEIFTEEDLSILKTIINQYKATQQVAEQEIEDDEIMVRSVRVFKKQFEGFAQFCKDNNINQAKALNTAIKNFIERYK